MTDPLSIFRATFLHYESLKQPAEMMAKAIMYKKKNENATTVLIALYSRGFYIKGVLNHFSGDKKKSRKNQFICAGLLKNVFKLQFKEEFVLWIFHETVELKTEALLFLFPNNFMNGCNHLFEYLKRLISDRYCSSSTLESFCVGYGCQLMSRINSPGAGKKAMVSKKRVVKNLENQHDLSESLMSNLHEEKENFHKLSMSEDGEKLHFSGFSKISNFGEMDESSEGETIFSLNSSLIQNYLHGDNEALKAIMLSRLEKKKLPNYDFENEYIIISDTETDQSIDSTFWKSNPNEYNEILDQLEGINTHQYLDLSNISYYTYFGEESEKSEQDILDDDEAFCWPEYLVSGMRIKSSILVEMTFTTNNVTSNWSLWEKMRNTVPLNDYGVLPELEWDEKISRIHYDPIAKTFEADDDGCLLIYCCRQKTKIDEFDCYY